jgi:hypothetical protein
MNIQFFIPSFSEGLQFGLSKRAHKIPLKNEIGLKPSHYYKAVIK